jgi:hypothetical protein
MGQRGVAWGAIVHEPQLRAFVTIGRIDPIKADIITRRLSAAVGGTAGLFYK